MSKIVSGLLLISLLLTGTALAATTIWKEVEVTLTPEGFASAGELSKALADWNQAAGLPDGLDIIWSAWKTGTVRLAVPEEDMARIHASLPLGATLVVLQEDMVAQYRRGMPQTPYGGYHGYNATIALLDSFHNAWPDRVSAKETVSVTVEGRVIWGWWLTSNPATPHPERPVVELDGLIHCREAITQEVVLFFTRWLVMGYGSDPLATQLLDSRRVMVVPCMNPDGWEFNELNTPGGGGMWRLNRSTNGDGTRGVDLNRNFGYWWGYDDVGSSPSPGSDLYRGPSPWSEPEGRGLRDWARNNAPKLSVNIHSYTGQLLYPFGYDTLVPQTNDLAAYNFLAENMQRHGVYYGAGPIARILYSANGNVVDWYYADSLKPKTIAFSCEIGFEADGFWPPSYRVAPLCTLMFPMCQTLARAAGGAVWVPAIMGHASDGGTLLDVAAGDTASFDVTLQSIGLIPASNITIAAMLVTGRGTLINMPLSPIYLPSLWDSLVPDAFRLVIPPHGGDGEKALLSVQLATADDVPPPETLSVWLGTGTVLWSSNFDADSGALQTVAGSPDWRWGIPTGGPGSAHSGNRCWALRLAGSYSDRTASYLRTQQFDLRTARAPRFQWWHWYSFESEGRMFFDVGRIEASLDGGAYTPVSPAGGYPACGPNYTISVMGQPTYGGYSGGDFWHAENLDLHFAAGHRVTLRFAFYPDARITGRGWFLDDMLLTDESDTSTAVAITSPLPPRQLKPYPNPVRDVVSFEKVGNSLPVLQSINGIAIPVDQYTVGPMGRMWQMRFSSLLPTGVYLIAYPDRNAVGRIVKLPR